MASLKTVSDPQKVAASQRFSSPVGNASVKHPKVALPHIPNHLERRVRQASPGLSFKAPLYLTARETADGNDHVV